MRHKQTRSAQALHAPSTGTFMLVTALPPSTSEAVSWSGICQRLLGAQDECFKGVFMSTFHCARPGLLRPYREQGQK